MTFPYIFPALLCPVSLGKLLGALASELHKGSLAVATAHEQPGLIETH